ncbi:tryptophan synthase subunit alpha [Streptomyces sp. NPDC048567]|uniref:tryptophan synthase subunit alpha n=1 Tax=unclassified Streptomyces TaxID=2593676 RepID=UPI002E81479B|nr:tryptophan synthase subunit alpha [Streptomyces sp. NBC_00523]WUD04636.1 tryptophan synthase subunit alpha [Streptomyces sp. NBC_00523]
MADFFTGRGPGRPGLTLFLNAGDPPLDELAEVVHMLDEEGVDCLELAVPFPDSFTDGPVVRRSARRALDRGTGLDDVLGFVARVRPGLPRLRIALLADWSHSLKHRDLGAAVKDVTASGADGLLVHGLPPRLRDAYREATEAAGTAVVTTCYPTSPEETRARAARESSAYVYLVAHYGRSGTAPPAGHAALAPVVAGLRAHTNSPIAVGFGVSTRSHVAAVAASGADAAIVGSAGVARVEQALDEEGSVTTALRDFVRSLQPGPDETSKANTPIRTRS